MAVDPRFYRPNGPFDLNKIAEIAGLELIGAGDRQISGVSSAATAVEADIAFIDGDGKSFPEINASVGAIVTNAQNVSHVPEGIPYLISKFPRYAHGKIATAMFTPRHLEWTSQKAIDDAANIKDGVVVGPGAVIGPGAAIGENTRIGPNAVIGPGVQIGKKCVIGANASVFCALIGNGVKLFSGARIGETGFGVTPGSDGVEDAPHFARVIIQDDVTIGANSCVDRGVFEDTIIGERARIDNLCQIAHNVVLGRSVLMAAFGGISGSVTVGDGSMLGGRVGIADHVLVGEGVSLAASSGLFKDVPAGETWGGTPAKPLRQWMREIAWVQKQSSNRQK